MKELVYSRLLESAVERHRDRTLLVDGDYEATWSSHWDRVLRAAGVLHGLGVDPGDRFAIVALNSHRYVELFHAAFLGAGVVNPVNTRLSDVEMQHILDDSGTKVVFVDDAYRAAIAPAAERLGLRMVGLSDGAGSYEELLAAASPTLPPEPEEDDPVVLMYTGGTTGLPKGVLHDQRGEMLNLYHVQLAFPLDERTRFLLNMPMFHVGGLTCALLAPAVGASVVVQAGFDAGAVLDAIETHGITDLGGVPTFLNLLLRHPGFEPDRLRSLRRMLCGGSALPLATLEEMEALLPGVTVMQGYGLTEAGLFVSALEARERDGTTRLASVGRPVLGVQVQIQDADDKVLPPGEIGEICVRGGNFLREYWNQPELTAATVRDGWYHTGDAGYLDEDGYLYIKDRVKDMIISGGENVYPAEVENAIASHPAVAQVAVIGIPHELWDEAVHAIVVLKPGAEADGDELCAHARGLIAGYKVPKSVEFRDEIPLSGPMKPLKRELRRPFWEGVEPSERNRVAP